MRWAAITDCDVAKRPEETVGRMKLSVPRELSL